MSDKYRIETSWGEEVIMVVDLTQASDSICYLNDDELIYTQYQTADARHNMHKAAELLLSTFGSDWLGDKDPEDVIDSVEPIEEE
jgi:hypothetical protein